MSDEKKALAESIAKMKEARQKLDQTFTTVKTERSTEQKPAERKPS